MAVIALANIVSRSDKTLSEMVAELPMYYASGEINTKLAERAKAVGVMEALKERYGAGIPPGEEKPVARGTVFELDGVSVEFDSWWFNVRCSNTEPLLRLNVEATTQAEMEAKRDELLEMIQREEK